MPGEGDGDVFVTSFTYLKPFCELQCWYVSFLPLPKSMESPDIKNTCVPRRLGYVFTSQDFLDTSRSVCMRVTHLHLHNDQVLRDTVLRWAWQRWLMVGHDNLKGLFQPKQFYDFLHCWRVFAALDQWILTWKGTQVLVLCCQNSSPRHVFSAGRRVKTPLTFCLFMQSTNLSFNIFSLSCRLFCSKLVCLWL